MTRAAYTVVIRSITKEMDDGNGNDPLNVLRGMEPPRRIRLSAMFCIFHGFVV